MHTPSGRHLVAALQVGADAVSHGATGKGNDQVRLKHSEGQRGEEGSGNKYL